jgi:hypothetical protein
MRAMASRMAGTVRAGLNSSATLVWASQVAKRIGLRAHGRTLSQARLSGKRRFRDKIMADPD